MYIYIYIDVRSYVYNVVDGVIGSIKDKYLVCCTHKCCKYKWRWNGGVHGYTYKSTHMLGGKEFISLESSARNSISKVQDSE